MKTTLTVLAATMTFAGTGAIAQEKAGSPQPLPAPSAVRELPPQAYDDCRGRKSGDAISHTTPEGAVAAICVDSPKGLVARPKQPRNPAKGAPEGRPAEASPGRS